MLAACAALVVVAVLVSPWVALALLVAGTAAVAWAIPSDVGSVEESRRSVEGLLEDAFASSFAPEVVAGALTRGPAVQETGGGVGGRTDRGSLAPAPVSTKARGLLGDAADAAVFGTAVAAADLGGTVESVQRVAHFINPDSAATAAYEHVTGQQFQSILDLRREFHAAGYDLSSPGSLSHWKGHTFEHQVNQQVEAWTGPGAIDVPEGASFAGADASLFGRPVQYKAYADFRDIDNKYGDTLIVPEDTANLPEGTPRIDFSQPFDPDLLESSNVIAAKGLTSVGAEDAWRTLGDPDMGGGLADVVGDAAGDLLGDAALLGMGTVIRTARSAYRRREALQDDDLRGLAGRKVAKDAGVSTAASLAGGTVGMLAFGPPGAVVGSMLAGMAAGQASRAIDNTGIERTRAAAVEAMEAFEAAREQARISGEAEFRSSVEAVERRCESMEAAFQAQAAVVVRDVEAALARSRAITEDERRIVLQEAVVLMEAPFWRRALPRSLWARRRWNAAAATLGPDAATADVFALLHAAPGGPGEVQEWVDARMERRAVALAAADHAVRRLTAQALAERAAAIHHLVQERTRIQEGFDREVAPAAGRLSARFADYERELAVNGRGAATAGASGRAELFPTEVVVPGVLHSGLREAEALLVHEGLRPVPSDQLGRAIMKKGNWFVLNQTPEAGTSVPYGTEIRLEVGKAGDLVRGGI